jgi:phytoene dehydrogenase-like protein
MSDEFDVIVIGGGVAGLCCAGELVLQGARTLLIPETKEVGFAIRPRMVDGNRGIMQVPTYMVGWGGGWWPNLARRLNADIKAPRGFNCTLFDLAVEGTGKVQPFTQSALTGAALNSMLAELIGTVSPELASSLGADSERVLTNALAIPYQELAKMDRVSITEWLVDQKADEIMTTLMFMIGGSVYGSTGEFVREHASVYGLIGAMRAFFCAEATFGFVYPDNREGLAIPLGRAIEGHGGTIWRGRKVTHIDISAGRVGSVVLSDGQEVRAPMVALACGNQRIAALLDSPPPEAEPALTYSQESLPHKDFHLFNVMDKPVLPPEFKNWVGVLNTQGDMVSWLHPVHAATPWAVKPGTQLVTSAVSYPAKEVDSGRYGTEDDIFARLQKTTESFYPGYQDAIGVTDRFTHKPGHLWYEPMCVGPKLPRSVDSVEGLWFVGEGSTPTCGFFMEGSASAGILGAREMLAHRQQSA